MGKSVWQLAAMTCLAMVAFAANSLLNRVAVESGAADPGSFAVIRVLSGAVMLAFLCALQKRRMSFELRDRVVGAGSLTLYMVGFSMAYLTMDAGLGALLLFGTVQITMLALGGKRLGSAQVVGAAIAFAGLAFVLWPDGKVETDLTAVGFMIAAGLGWGLYSLAGRGARDPLAATGANFVVSLPLTLAAVWLFGEAWDVNWKGVGFAVVSGAVTSGLGYALWYRVLPRLDTSVAATVQLSVPVIAIAGGGVFLGEVISTRLILGTILVLGGIGVAIRFAAKPTQTGESNA